MKKHKHDGKVINVKIIGVPANSFAACTPVQGSVDGRRRRGGGIGKVGKKLVVKKRQRLGMPI